MGGLAREFNPGERRLLKVFGPEILNRAVKSFISEGLHCVLEQLETKCKSIVMERNAKNQGRHIEHPRVKDSFKRKCISSDGFCTHKIGAECLNRVGFKICEGKCK